jgi:eukaryotic-like serine/threonine-protein kinase
MTTAVLGRSGGGLDLEKELLKAGLAGALFGNSNTIRIGRFDVLRCIGRGGTGAVYDAVDRERGGRVALKVLSRLEPGAIARLKHEFRSLRDVLHTNLVKLHELFHAEAQWFFSMELIEGEPFDRWVRTAQGALDLDRLRSALGQLARGVQAIHGAGQLHRDLKPSNVLVTAEGRVVVLDFGLATAITDDAPHSGAVLGTPAYMAPEQAKGAAATQASDWYAVGVMLFEALTGRLPFAGDALAMLRDKQSRDAPDPRTLLGDLACCVPADLSELCVALLQRDSYARAGGEDVMRSAGARGAAPDEARGRESVFVGRTAELAALDEALAATTLGAPVLVLVRGGSGMGKSALLERFAELAASRALVLRGRCYEQESMPYKVFDGIADALASHLDELPPGAARRLLPRHLPALARLFPVLGHALGDVSAAAGPPAEFTEPRELRSRAFEAFKELLHNLSRVTQLVIAVDDLQWGDTDSVRMLRHLMAAPDALPLLFVGAVRDGDINRSEFLKAATRMLRELPLLALRRIEVGPLEQGVAVELARRLLDGSERSEATARSITQESLGLPFFIAELARSVNAHGEHAAGAPSSLDQLIVDRVASLPEDARDLLRLLCAAAGPLERSAAIDAAGLCAGDWVATHALRSGRLIRTQSTGSGELLEVYHDRIRESVAGRLSPSELRTAHASIVRALESGSIPVDPERLMNHLLGAGNLEHAGDAAVQAAHAAVQKLAFDRAATLFARAIEFLPAARKQALELQRHLGDALVNAGRGADAAAAYRRAAEGLAPDQARHMLRLAAKHTLRSANPQQGAALARSVLRSVGVHTTSRDSLVPLLWERARLTVRGLHHGTPRASTPPRAERLETLRDLFPELMTIGSMSGFSLQARYLREGLDHGDPGHILHGLVWEACNSAFWGGSRNRQRAERVLRMLEPMAAQIDTPQARAMAHLAEASCRLWSGRQFTDAFHAASAAHGLFTRGCVGTFWERINVGYMQLFALEPMMELARHAAITAEHVRDADEREDQFAAATLVLAVPLTYMAADEVSGALEYLERQRQLADLAIDTRNAWWGRTGQALGYAGRVREAVEMTEAGWPAFRRSPHHACEFARGTMSQHRARRAVAAFCETRDPALRRLAWRTTLEIQDSTNVFGAARASLLGSLYAIDRDDARALRWLQLSREGFAACQAGASGLASERVMHQIRRDHAGVDRVDADLRKLGVACPERWVKHWVPTPF